MVDKQWSSSPEGTYVFTGTTVATKDFASNWNSYCRSDNLSSLPDIQGIYSIVPDANWSNNVVGYTYQAIVDAATQEDEAIVYYGLYFRGDGLRIMKNGSTEESTTWTAGKTYSIEMSATNIVFKEDGSEIHTITEVPPSQTYFMVGTVYTNTQTITGIASDNAPSPPSSGGTRLPPPPIRLTL